MLKYLSKEIRPNSSAKTKRLLIIAHNHPHFFPGGAEIFAYDLFQAIRNTDYAPFFLAAASVTHRHIHTGTPFQTLVDAPDEMLFWGDAFDHFYQSQKILNFMYVDFKKLLQQLQPDIIHFHHSIRIGLEAIQVARQTLPDVKIVYTLHEFILICYRDGQMVRKHTDELCEAASPSRCHQCFSEFSPQQFMMREVFIKAHLDHVDRFIAPSSFLAHRFVDWGIPKEKMTVIENGRQILTTAPHRTLAEHENRNIFGFFGQINPYKGVLLILKAAEYLVKQNFTNFRVELFGNIGASTPEFEKEFSELLFRCQNYVTWHGQYRNEEMPELIRLIDWVIVPSVWWENSPLVIQEALMHKRPILCSDIGGMAEKVENNVTGLHFRVKNHISLAEVMKRTCLEFGLWERLVQNISPRLSIEDCAAQHIQLYDRL
ncbi:MAG: glycosyltransferase family 4 protein [Cyanobacteria bacterium RU_5_0]|nr:glycosyltransferase family 4 protein [Cyanobacteria bacterium RU_5_0]